MTTSAIIRLLGGLTLLVIMSMTLAACEGDQPEPTTVPPQAPHFAPTPFMIDSSITASDRITSPQTAEDILRETTAAMADVQSGRIDVAISISLGGDESTMLQSRVSGAFQLPDRTQATMSVTSQGITIEFEVIAIGNEWYAKNPLTGEWEDNSGDDDPLDNFLAAPAFNTDVVDEDATQFELVGREVLDGESVYYLRAAIPGSDLAELMEDLSLVTAEGEINYWIGVDDFLVRRIEIRSEQRSDGNDIGMGLGIGAIVTHSVIVLSDYNTDVEIVAPEVQRFLLDVPGNTTT